MTETQTQEQAADKACSADTDGAIAAVAGDLVDILGGNPRVGRCQAQGVGEYRIYDSNKAPAVCVTVWPDREVEGDGEARAEGLARAISKAGDMLSGLLEAVDLRDGTIANLQEQAEWQSNEIGTLLVRIAFLEIGLKAYAKEHGDETLAAAIIAKAIQAARETGVTDDAQSESVHP